MEGTLVTVMILAVSAAAAIMAVKFHESRVRHANIQREDTVRQHRRLTSRNQVECGMDPTSLQLINREKSNRSGESRFDRGLFRVLIYLSSGSGTVESDERARIFRPMCLIPVFSGCSMRRPAGI